MDTAKADRAPGPLDLLRLLVNTLDYPTGPDELGTPESATKWCRNHGLSSVSTHADLERLHAFREAVRDLLYANNGEGDVNLAWERMRPFLASSRFALRLVSHDAPALEAQGAGIDRTIATLLAIVYDAVAAGTWTRLRACRKSNCRFAYYDQSKNGSRAWCSMALCGNRVKAQRRRSRDRHDVAR